MHTLLTQTCPLFEFFFFQMSLMDWKYMLSKTSEESKRLKIKLANAFMPVLITSNFDDAIKTECPWMETPSAKYFPSL